MIEGIQSRLAKALETQGGARAIRTHWGAALGSSVGQVRTRNEDRCLVARASYAQGGRAKFTVAVVCDGLGGMSQGREAAILAASAFTAHLFCSPAIEWKERLLRAIAYANSEVYQRLRGDGGTTLSAVISSQYAGAMLCHVGDSRVYGVSSDRAIKQLSRDDTISALMKRNEGESDGPKDSRLLQFVGMGDEMEAQVASVPSHCSSILLTTDGAHDVPHSVLQRVVSAAAGGSDLIRKLLTLSDIMGGRDNASVILLPIGSEADLFEEIGGNELLTILPNDTLSIYIADIGAWERSGRMRGAPVEISPREQSGRIEELSTNVDVASGESDLKSDLSKRKERVTKPRKAKRRGAHPKADAADRLPLEAPNEEVDVRFSSPAALPGEGKE